MSIIELAYTFNVTEKCDVYSFGVVALETLMGKHLREIMSSLSKSTTQNMLLKDLLDSRLPLPYSQKEPCESLLQAIEMFKSGEKLKKISPRPSFRAPVQENLSHGAPVLELA
ncbi:hypothetical protein Fmac_011843 [Flemingia macrophylla]|uniref:non-specific serine/threonine protein kinase n=1 Tax=Flemingia macrophylla TaxID=520843 RepID=A0ABD1MPF8_9FABA